MRPCDYLLVTYQVPVIAFCMFVLQQFQKALLFMSSAVISFTASYVAGINCTPISGSFAQEE